MHTDSSKRMEAPRPERLPLTAEDERLVRKWAEKDGFTADVASSVARQGWISAKQRAVLLRDGARPASVGGSRNYGLGVGYAGGSNCGYRQKDDYDESDYEIGAYELCVDGMG